jgi:hypothetical protein
MPRPSASRSKRQFKLSTGFVLGCWGGGFSFRLWVWCRLRFRFRLQLVQEFGCALGMGGGAENGAFVAFEDF